MSKKAKETFDRRGRSLLNRFDRFVDTAREASSRGAAYLYATLGIIVQATHTGMLVYNFSQYESELARIVQAGMMAGFVSLALFYFVLIADDKTYSKSSRTLYVFYILEIWANLFYYFDTIILTPWQTNGIPLGDLNWTGLLIAIPFSFWIPYAIKQFGGQVHSHKPAVAMDDDDFVKETDVAALKREFAELKAAIDILQSDTSFAALEEIRENHKTSEELIAKYEQIESALKPILSAAKNMKYNETSAFIDKDDIVSIVRENAEDIIKDNTLTKSEIREVVKILRDDIHKITSKAVQKGETLTLTRDDGQKPINVKFVDNSEKKAEAAEAN